MKCPVCEKEMASRVCTCGYDESRNYGQYPTFGRLPEGVVSVAGLRDRRNNLVRCGGCGGHTFTLNRKTGALACSSCGRALTEVELKPLTDALGMKKAESKSKPVPAPKPKAPAAQTHEKSNAARLTEFGDLLNVLKKQASKQENPKRIVSIAAGWNHTVALYADGTVAVIGDNKYGQCDVSSWRDIVAISAGSACTTGLKKDGTVVQAGVGSYAVKEWKDIIAIAGGYHHTVGLKRDGTVVAAGLNEKGCCQVSGWRNIQSIATGDGFTLGLEKSGKVVMAGRARDVKNNREVQRWKGIKAIAAGYGHCAALDMQGNLLVAGEVGTFKDKNVPIIDLDAGGHFTVILRKDGTAEVVGDFFGGRGRVENWKDLEKIAAGQYHTVGLKKDGTLVATGNNQHGQCDVDKLMRQ